MLRPYRDRLPQVAPSAWIDDSAQVIGDVTVGEDCSIWMNAVVRGDVHWIRIGRRTNLQDGVVVHVMRDQHPTEIGDDVTVAHGVMLHGCRIHDRVLIGIGAIVLNGAEVESDCIVAAGALVVEGMKVPARSLVMGNPAKVRRALTDDEVAMIRDLADRYVHYRLDYVR